MQNFLKHFSLRVTRQDAPIPGAGQVANSAGGYAWELDVWGRLDRFLILGTDGGTYYVSERQLTRENAQAVLEALQADGLRVVRRVVEISEAGRAPKNDPALFALAMATALGTPEVKRSALEALPRVARIGTHLFHFLAYVEGFRGWGRGLRRAVGSWYNGKQPDELAYQLVKYQSRDGWSHRDALRLAHPVPLTPEHGVLYKWATRKNVAEAPSIESPGIPLLEAVQAVRAAREVADVTKLVTSYRLPREALPTEWLTEAKVWEALLADMPMEAMVRNLATMTRVGLLGPRSSASRLVVERLRDAQRIRKARLHPFKLFAALITYQQGRGMRGSGQWEPVTEVVDALNDAFYLAFGNVEPSGKRLVIALDVSGSMGGGQVAGVPGLSPRVAAAAMALVTAATEKETTLVAFSDKMVPLTISPRQRLDDVVKATSDLPFGRTDCALPMLWALEKKVDADAFMVLTDSETWFGQIHPTQALQRYRERRGIPAKLMVVGMVANTYTIADPRDAGMLDVVGFDTATPQLLADFAAGRL
ncbi:MAG TPA: TROVE domain-containing protein [Oscillatoriaceae cyanobacterium]